MDLLPDAADFYGASPRGLGKDAVNGRVRVGAADFFVGQIDVISHGYDVAREAGRTKRVAAPESGTILQREEICRIGENRSDRGLRA